MPAIAPIVINDGESTPVAHTFNPLTTQLPAQFAENGIGLSLIAEPTVSVNLIRSSSMNTVREKIMVPVMEEVAGEANGYVAPPKVAYFLQATVEFKLPARSTEQQRKNIRTLCSNMIASSLLASVVDRVEAPY